jgi:hypothetical protein
LVGAQGEGAANGPTDGAVHGARGPTRIAGWRVAQGNFKTFWGAGRPGEGAALDGVQPREVRHAGAAWSALWLEIVST